MLVEWKGNTLLIQWEFGKLYSGRFEETLHQRILQFVSVNVATMLQAVVYFRYCSENGYISGLF
jgi:hypothetical protein